MAYISSSPSPQPSKSENIAIWKDFSGEIFDVEITEALFWPGTESHLLPQD